MKKPKSEKWYAAMAAKKGSTAKNQYSKAKDLGLPKPQISEESRLKMSAASSERRHTDETKKKISESRIKFLRENPDQVPYKLNHYSKGRSYAEEYWKVVLDSNNIVYQEQYQLDTYQFYTYQINTYQLDTYQLDFAFPELKIDLEIDGDQHHLDERIVESDKRRNLYL